MATVALRSQRLRNEEGANVPDKEEEEGCTHNTAKDRNKSYYNKATGASKLHNLLRSHHRVDGKDIHVPVDGI